MENIAKKTISKLKDGEYRLSYHVPYVSQYASAERAEEFVNDDKLLLTDTKWRESGAESIEEYIFWAPKLCGMACFKMILGSPGNQVSKLDMPLIVLGKKAMEAKCYLPDPKNPNRLIGVLHAPFLKFTEQFGFKGKLLWYIDANAIANEILSNNFVIASVHHDIRHRGAWPDSKQGHLVLVIGFEVKNGRVGGLYIHNPSGFYKESQENYFVLVENFLKCFSGRIIVLRSG